MSASFVWGVVLIVLGVVGVISGFSQYAEALQLDQLARDIAQQFNVHKAFSGYAKASHDAKMGAVIKMIGGLCLSVYGTWMVQKARHRERAEERGQRDFLEFSHNQSDRDQRDF